MLPGRQWYGSCWSILKWRIFANCDTNWKHWVCKRTFLACKCNRQSGRERVRRWKLNCTLFKSSCPIRNDSSPEFIASDRMLLHRFGHFKNVQLFFVLHFDLHIHELSSKINKRQQKRASNRFVFFIVLLFSYLKRRLLVCQRNRNMKRLFTTHVLTIFMWCIYFSSEKPFVWRKVHMRFHIPSMPYPEMDNNLFTVFCIRSLRWFLSSTDSHFMLPDFRLNVVFFLLLSRSVTSSEIVCVFAWFYVHLGEWPVFVLLMPSMANIWYANHLDRISNGFCDEQTKETYYRMKYSHWCHQFNGIHFCFGLLDIWHQKLIFVLGLCA